MHLKTETMHPITEMKDAYNVCYMFSCRFCHADSKQNMLLVRPKIKIDLNMYNTSKWQEKLQDKEDVRKHKNVTSNYRKYQALRRYFG